MIQATDSGDCVDVKWRYFEIWFACSNLNPEEKNECGTSLTIARKLWGNQSKEM